MYKHTRTIAAIAAASLLAAFAAQANKGAHYPNTSYTDADDFKYFVTGGATYLTPSYDVLNYATIFAPGASTGNFVSNGENVQPGYNWGYFLAAGYMIRKDFDVQGSWTAFNSESSDNTSTTGLSDLITSNNLILPLGSTSVATASSEETLTYQAFDATIGQYHEIKDNLSTRIFAGIRYAKIDLDVDNKYTITGLSTVLVNDYDSTFSGVGPEVGMDLEYKVHKMIGIVAHFAGAFVIGTQDAESNLAFDLSPLSQVESKADSEVRMIPALDAKLGVNVDFPFHHFTDAIVVEAGYQAAYYFNAVNQVNSELLGSSAFLTSNEYSDVGIMGPYLNISTRW